MSSLFLMYGTSIEFTVVLYSMVVQVTHDTTNGASASAYEKLQVFLQI